MTNLKLTIKEKLSPREAEVAKYLILGKRTNFIAKELGLKANTISTLKKKIYLKLGINSSVELYMLIGNKE